MKTWYSYDRNAPLPKNLVIAGKDIDGAPLYAGRAYHLGDLLPAKVFLNHCKFGTAAHVSYDDRELDKHNFELLLEIVDGMYVWRCAANGEVPNRAMEVGYSVKGEILYLARGNHLGAVITGKVHPSHQCLFIPFDGSEIRLKEYEVLCLK